LNCQITFEKISIEVGAIYFVMVYFTEWRNGQLSKLYGG